MPQNTAASDQSNTPQLPMSDISSTTCVYISFKQNTTPKEIVVKLYFRQTELKSGACYLKVNHYATLSLNLETLP